MMKATYCCIVALLGLRTGCAFQAVPVPLRAHTASTSRTNYFLSAAKRGDTDTSRIEPEDGPILLPPADYSKPGSVMNLGEDSGAEVGHVMLNRKITLSFTCNVCDGHSSYQINRVSFMQGIVVLWCKNCNQQHLIADNLGKLDFPEFGRNLEEFMAKKGTPVKRVVMSKEGLSHVEAQVPGNDYPEVNPYLIAREGDELVLPEDFDSTSLLPGVHVGGAGCLPGVTPPPASAAELGGVDGEGGENSSVDGAGADA